MAVAYTIVTANYLFQARTMMESVAQHWPAARRCVIVIDPPAEPPAAAEDFEIIAADRLGLPGFRHHAFLLDALALCCLLKPIAAQYLCEAFSSDLVAYFDSDTLLYAPPRALLEAPAQAPIFLTPHLLSPVPPGLNRSDFNFLLSGVFNAGFFAVQPGPESRRFLSWWRANLDQPGHLRPEWAFDQAWLNAVPVYFPAVEILRDPGFNVAYWNLHERPLAGDEPGRMTVAGTHPLVLFHFSFFNPDHPDILAQKGITFEPADSAPVRALTRDYAQRLDRNGRADCRSQAYRYGQFADGAPITERHREYYRVRIRQTPASEGDPFDPRFRVPGAEGLKSLYHVNHPLTLLIRRLRRVRQAALGPDRTDF